MSSAYTVIEAEIDPKLEIETNRAVTKVLPYVSSEFNDLVAFVRNGLLDQRALCRTAARSSNVDALKRGSWPGYLLLNTSGELLAPLDSLER